LGFEKCISGVIGSGKVLSEVKVVVMTEGTIKKLTDKGFGFIDDGSGKDMFFHMSNLDGLQFDDLQEGQRVEYTEGQGPKGPRAENVRVI
jgi:CspA family cold shock protein